MKLKQKFIIILGNCLQYKNVCIAENVYMACRNQHKRLQLLFGTFSRCRVNKFKYIYYAGKYPQLFCQQKCLWFYVCNVIFLLLFSHFIETITH